MRISVACLQNFCQISDKYVRHLLCQLNICKMSVNYPAYVCPMSIEI